MTEQTDTTRDDKPSSAPDSGSGKAVSNSGKPKAKPADKPKKKAGARWPGVLALLVALGAAGGSGYTWYIHTQQLAGQKQQLTELQTTLRALDEHSSMIEIKQRLNEQRQQLDDALAEQQETIDALYQAFEVTQSIVNRDQRGWILAEVEYLMRLANVRLRLTRDINGATQALITADERLADLGDPAILEVRERLSDEISALKAVSVPDVEGAALKLISIANRLHLLPAAKRPATEEIEQPAAETTPEPEGFFKRTGWRILNFIGVRRSDAPVTTAKLQSELYYVEQLLRLELARAREAALRADRDGFQRHLNAARGLLDQHYERENEQVIRIRAELAALQESELIPPLPDITGSLRKLRELQLKYRPEIDEPETDS